MPRALLRIISAYPIMGSFRAPQAAHPPGISHLQLSVQWYLVSVSQTVGFVRHADHRKELTKRFFRHSRLLRSFSMRMDTVITIVSDAHSDVDQLLGQGIEYTGCHHLFYAFPGPP